MFDFGRGNASRRLIVIKMLDGNNDRHRTRREGRLYRTRHKVRIQNYLDKKVSEYNLFDRTRREGNLCRTRHKGKSYRTRHEDRL